MMVERWLTYREAAQRAGVSVRQVRTWRNVGTQGHKLVGRVDPETGRFEVEERVLMEHARWAAWCRSRFSSTVQPARQGKGTA